MHLIKNNLKMNWDDMNAKMECHASLSRNPKWSQMMSEVIESSTLLGCCFHVEKKDRDSPNPYRQKMIQDWIQDWIQIRNRSLIEIAPAMVASNPIPRQPSGVELAC